MLSGVADIHTSVYAELMGRIQLVLEDGLYKEIEKRAKKNGASRSMVARDLIRKGLEIEEDLVLSRVASDRMTSFDADKAVSHESIKKKFP